MEVHDYHQPCEFKDVMTRGLFAHFSHHYVVSATTSGCLLQDTFSFELPFGKVGEAFAHLLLARSLASAQHARLNAIKEEAERRIF